MKRSLLYIICLLAFFVSCSEVKIPSKRPEIVVEGWIEGGGFPVVIVTSSIPIDMENHDWDEISKYIIRWAKVSVSDGESEVVLTGKLDNDYFPPFIYTTSRMMGEAGKSYSLKVEYSGRVETATTTVPASVPLEYVKVVKKDDGYGVLAGLKDNRQTKDYYRFFSMVEGHDSTYVPSFLGLMDDAVLSDGVNEIYVNGAFNDNWGTVEKSPTHYAADDIVCLRLSTMDEVSYAYWSDYDDVASLSTNPFFPVHKKIRSNVSSGMGYWAGYGSSYYTVSIADSLALGRVWPAED